MWSAKSESGGKSDIAKVENLQNCGGGGGGAVTIYIKIMNGDIIVTMLPKQQ